MKKVLYISMLAFSCLAFGQKVKIKKDIVYVDGQQWLLAEKDAFNCSIFDKNKNEIIFIKYIKQSIGDNMLFNRSGKPNYYLVKFIGTDKSIEIRELPEDILKIIYKSNVVNPDLTLNPDKLRTLVEKYGNDFSKDTGSTTL
ncbi:hypothetical protein HHL23_10350 [Chryseobacterium sp. RP-3-3]|uniref:Uncharacterized protein n=1 Tax=Chryseobacterium antibioticum TaxID=2728847 RepID=A0A7Y0FRG4_9FLAO|nr:hypothetical protein [Chryseobacterium antibioticum]NML70197.1 hypothetical protein [Chryseobacterium antibioticum]